MYVIEQILLNKNINYTIFTLRIEQHEGGLIDNNSFADSPKMNSNIVYPK